MKYLIFLTALFLSSSLWVVGQNEFAPIGAKWYYEVSTWSSLGDEGLFVLESLKDTTISEQNCKKISSVLFNATFTPLSTYVDTFYFSPIFVYQDGSKVFLIDDNFENSSLLYDFNPQIGDVWELNTLESAPYILCDENTSQNMATVDGINQINIDGSLLNQLFTMDSIDESTSYINASYNYFSNPIPIIEKIGNLRFLLPVCNLISGVEFGRLRCYEDSILFYKNPNIQNVECNYVAPQNIVISSIESPTNNNQNILFTINNGEVIFQKSVDIIKIFGINGKEIHVSKNQESTISLIDYPKGLLIIQAIDFTTENQKTPISESTLFFNP